MSKILINNSFSGVVLTDVGVTVAANSSYTIPPQDYPQFAASSDVIVAISNLYLTLNDGSNDITNISNAVDIIKGWFPGSSTTQTEPFFFDFSDVISGDAAVTLISYSVLVGQTLDLSHLEVSCRLESVIEAQQNGQVIATLRTGAAQPKDSLIWYPNRVLIAGDLIEIIITKRTGTPDVSVGAHLMGTLETL